MRMTEIIAHKQAGLALSKEEIYHFVNGFTAGDIPDYQASALLMAIYFQGMSVEEAADLTLAMANSGDQLDLSAIDGIKVDKHSTGGVGDTTTLILSPLVASLGVPVAKMSGRGLGHTGGTIDKLEAIPGFNTELSVSDFIEAVNQIKLGLVGQTGNLTPADKKIYALRDVTNTVQSIPLIASSIMSKKIAAGADAIILDVKVGEGAFMKTVEEAEELAHLMVQIGKAVGRQTLAIISNMDQPLGHAVGNALEVQEAIACLKGEGPQDLTDLSVALASQMLLAADRVDSLEEGQTLLQEQIRNGQALAKFKEFIANQGGDVTYIDDSDRLPQARYQIPILAPESGYIASWHTQTVGEVARILGAGRATKDDQIDPAVGLVVHKKLGESVEAGEVVATLYSQSEEATEAVRMMQGSFTITSQAESAPLIYEMIAD
ncbi:pyrimidine-nucleoside phosphorylase [Hutsoniella sourekii]